MYFSEKSMGDGTDRQKDKTVHYNLYMSYTESLEIAGQKDKTNSLQPFVFITTYIRVIQKVLKSLDRRTKPIFGLV